MQGQAKHVFRTHLHRRGLAITLAVLMGLFTAAGASADDDARALMERINEQYHERLDEPRRIEIEQTSTVRIEGNLDVVTESTFVAHQQGERASMRLLDSVVSQVGNPAFTNQRGALRQYWVFDGRYLKWLHETTPHPITGLTTINAHFVDNKALPEEAGLEFTSPLRSAELHDVFLEADFSLYEDLFRGRRVIVLDSVRPFAVNDETVMLRAEIWVDAETLEIVHAQTRMRHEREDGSVSHLENSQTFTTTWGVDIDEQLFTLELPKSAVDSTEMVAAKAAMKKQSP
jgi:hypothetical protein